MSHHICQRCMEEAISERCPGFQFDWELEDSYGPDVPPDAPTVRGLDGISFRRAQQDDPDHNELWGCG